MLNQFLKIFQKEYTTLNKIELSQSNFLKNYKYLSSINKKIKIAPVVKGNAYGHGIAETAKILEKCNPPFFCVDSLYEAYELLKANIKIPILIMGYTDLQNIKIKKLPFSYSLFDLQTAEVLNKYQKGASVHIFVDTGMHREGVVLKDLTDFLKKVKSLPYLKIEGLMSHFASADDKKTSLNKIQIKNFKVALEICKKEGIFPKWIHIANSDGLTNFSKDLGFTNMARIGLSAYGVSVDKKLKPVLTLKTKIIQIKNLNKGHKVGYSGTYTTKHSITLGVLPIGYYDGVDRRLSNKGYVSVSGIFCPIIGRVSMNITTIDISKIKDPFIGQEVIVYSNKPKDKSSIDYAAGVCQTVRTDLLALLSPSTKRVIV